MSIQNVPDRPRIRDRFISRVGISLAVAAAVLAVTYPYDGVYDPEGNFLRGPMWLLLNQKPDSDVGVDIALPCSAAFGIARGFPNRVAMTLGVMALAVWVATGIYLQMLAAC